MQSAASESRPAAKRRRERAMRTATTSKGPSGWPAARAAAAQRRAGRGEADQRRAHTLLCREVEARSSGDARLDVQTNDVTPGARRSRVVDLDRGRASIAELLKLTASKRVSAALVGLAAASAPLGGLAARAWCWPSDGRLVRRGRPQSLPLTFFWRQAGFALPRSASPSISCTTSAAA